jgi:hypothetical protein
VESGSPSGGTESAGLARSSITRKNQHRSAPQMKRADRAPQNPLSALAAYGRVGHIGLTGDVAEWLKAAVC